MICEHKAYQVFIIGNTNMYVRARARHASTLAEGPTNSEDRKGTRDLTLVDVVKSFQMGSRL